jgi:hypothetical protein
VRGICALAGGRDDNNDQVGLPINPRRRGRRGELGAVNNYWGCSSSSVVVHFLLSTPTF